MARKESFINDKRRVSYLGAVYNRIYRGKSVLIEGGCGVGKSRFLKLVAPKKLRAVRVESLFGVHETMASILRELNYETAAHCTRTPGYLKTICSPADFFLILDKANDLGRTVRPWLKRIMDAQVPVVMAGLPSVRTFLKSEHPDILSRLKTPALYPVEVEDFIEECKGIEAEAVEQIYAAARGDMRKFEEICTDCRDRAKQLEYGFADVNPALEFISDLPSE